MLDPRRYLDRIVEVEAALARLRESILDDNIPRTGEIVLPPSVETYMMDLAGVPTPPRPPSYSKPRLEDCDWIINGFEATSTRGLATIRGTYPYLIAPAYKASHAAGHIPNGSSLTVGIYGSGGRVTLATGYNSNSDMTLAIPTQAGGWEDLSLRIVGLDQGADFSFWFGTQWGYVQRLEIHDIGIRGIENNQAVPGSEGIGTLILDGHWFVPFSPTFLHESFMHIDRWRRLVVNNQKWKGARARRHNIYGKSCVGGPQGGTWFTNNDLRGGNQTGVQLRPGAGDPTGNTRPAGVIVFSGNIAEGRGWEHGEGVETFDGGGCISVWANPDYDTWVINNRILDDKYSCIMVGAQPPSPITGQDNNWYNERGFPIGRVYMYGNVVENSHNGHPPNLPRRSAINVHGVEELHLWDNWLQNGASFELDGRTAHQYHDIRNGNVLVYTGSAPRWPAVTWDPKAQRLIPITLQRNVR